MRSPIALTLHRLLARQGAPIPNPAAVGARPSGTVLWLHGTGPGTAATLAQVAREVQDEALDCALIVTTTGLTAPEMSGFPDGTISQPDPGEAGADAFLDHWRPDAVVLSGNVLPPLVVTAAADRGIPLVLCEFRMEGARATSALFSRSLVSALLPRFARIFVPDSESAMAVRLALGPNAAVAVSGRIEEADTPLSHNEAERLALADAIGTRPVWCAAACPLDETDAVLSAHAQALRMAHRMLLILVPADAADGPEMAARCADKGFEAAVRSHDDELTEDVQVLVADTEGEHGLWYRLAPVTFLGGSLVGQGPNRSPTEPATLGSAVISGPKSGAQADRIDRLTEARALRLVRTADSLGEAVADLIAPDRAALLAHNAWVALSGGADAARAVAQAAMEEADAAVARRKGKP